MTHLEAERIQWRLAQGERIDPAQLIDAVESLLRPVRRISVDDWLRTLPPEESYLNRERE